MFGRWLALAVLLLLPNVAFGHDGPPYPLLVDEKAGPYTISVWADPDVGTGTFFITVAGEPEDVEVTVSVQPTSGRLAEKSYTARREKSGRSTRYVGEVEFDAQEYWKVRFEVKGPAGRGERLAEVEATPPGLGPWDFALYLFPFVLLAGLWAYGMIRSRSRHRQAGPRQDEKQESGSSTLARP
jgi:hypothetical protein